MPRRRTCTRHARWLAAAVALLALTGLAPLQAAAPEAPAPVVNRARIEGVINPFSARYLERAIRETERSGAAALVVELDTPGGLDTAMRSMIQAELNSHAPVIVYVAPSGARAASAGMFITLAAHVAAMAPGTAAVSACMPMASCIPTAAASARSAREKTAISSSPIVLTTRPSQALVTAASRARQPPLSSRAVRSPCCS